MKGVKTWMAAQWNKDDLFYVCSMIEFVARETHNKVKDIVILEEEIRNLIEFIDEVVLNIIDNFT